MTQKKSSTSYMSKSYNPQIQSYSTFTSFLLTDVQTLSLLALGGGISSLTLTCLKVMQKLFNFLYFAKNYILSRLLIITYTVVRD
jgi:hypothetical protein